MLAKLTTKNQITIPRDIISRLPNVRYFDVDYDNGVVFLKPVKVYDADLKQIRTKIKKIGSFRRLCQRSRALGVC